MPSSALAPILSPSSLSSCLKTQTALPCPRLTLPPALLWTPSFPPWGPCSPATPFLTLCFYLFLSPDSSISSSRCCLNFSFPFMNRWSTVDATISYPWLPNFYSSTYNNDIPTSTKNTLAKGTNDLQAAGHNDPFQFFSTHSLCRM